MIIFQFGISVFVTLRAYIIYPMARNKRASRKNQNNRKQNYNNPNFWGMIQNIMIAGMNKGQLLPTIFGLILIILALKISPEVAGTLFFEMVVFVKNIWYIGWTLAILSIFGWYFGTKKLRRLHAKEMDRVSLEKSNLQELAAQKLLASSNLT